MLGRPTLLTADRSRRIAELVAAGNDVETSALAAGISRATFLGWMARGRAERERLEANPRLKVKQSEVIYVNFLDEIETARAQAEARYVLRIAQASDNPDKWQAAAWMLTHGPNKSKWAEVSKTELSGPNGGAIQSEVRDVSDVALVALADQVMGIAPVIPEIEADG